MSSASELIADFGNGSLNDRLTAAIKEVSDAVLLNEKPGTVSLKLTFTAKGGMVIVGSTVAMSPPKAKNEQMYYPLPGGGLSRRDPAQPVLERNDGSAVPQFDDRAQRS